MKTLPDLPAKTPLKDIIQAARKHYDEISAQAGWWSSTIPHAINALETQELSNIHLPLRFFNVKVDLFIRFGGGRKYRS